MRNCNRIIRVAGSINWKNGKDGRVPAPCSPCTFSSQSNNVDEIRATLASYAEQEQAGTLQQLNETLKEAGALDKRYGSWSDVTLALAAVLKSYGNLSPEMMAAVLMAPLPCNQHVTKLKGDKRHRPILRALNNSYRPKQSSGNADGTWPDGTNEFGTPNNTYGNCLVAVVKLRVEFWQDVFRNKPFVSGDDVSDDLSGEVSDAAISALRHAVYKQFHFHPVKETMVEVVGIMCRARKVDPVLRYYAGLPEWDGTPRIDMLFIKYLGAEDTPLNRAFGRKFMCAKVRRAKQPGCKWDHIPVVEGEQGKRKSMFCEDLAIAPDLFTDTSVLAGTTKEQMEIMAGKDVIELGEMAGLHQTTRSRIKAFITRKRDRGRMAYDRFAIDLERRGVCIGTSNPSKYLSDSTGERRWWPIAMTMYDHDAFLTDKDQLYAEAVAMEPHENIWLDTAELAAAHAALVETRKEPNELVDLLSSLRGEVFSLGAGVEEERVGGTAVRNFIGMANSDALRIQGLGTRIAEAMAHLGWSKADRTMVCRKNWSPERGYRRPHAPPLRPEPEQREMNLGPGATATEEVPF